MPGDLLGRQRLGASPRAVGAKLQGFPEMELRVMADYYDVLGVRPGAKLIEIELAFKGRRTQYHPDRYDQSDIEAVRWATQRMQEVNEAFAVLRDPDRRRAFDASWAASAPPRNESRRESERAHAEPSQSAGFSGADGSPESAMPVLLDYLLGLELAGGDESRLHLYPRISPKIRENVYSSREWYGRHGVEKLICVLDDTLAGGSKEGVAITEKLISFKSIFSDSNDYFYSSGFRNGIQAHRDTVYIGNESVKSFVHVSPASLESFCYSFNRFLHDCESWHLDRANRGSAESQVFMSCAAPYDSEEALHWLQLAAENGHSTAQHNLACTLQSKDLKAAFYWFSEASRQGVELSASRLKDRKFDRFRSSG